MQSLTDSWDPPVVVPSGHGTHPLFPVVFLYVPPGQWIHIGWLVV